MATHLPLDVLTEFFQAQGTVAGRTFHIAFSGGRDSHVLLHLATQLRATTQSLQLRAVHVHHGMHAEADAWAVHCEKTARALGIDFYCEKLSFSSRPQNNIEEALRDARYAVFARLLQPGDILLTAHHQQDQAETVLLQLLRGAGPQGLAAMPAIKPFAAGLHARPLLSLSPAQLAAYAKTHALQWLEDDTNQDTRFVRNFMRHRILPLLTERQPGAVQALARVARNCARVTTVLKDFVAYRACAGNQPETLSACKLRALSFLQACQQVRSFLYIKNIRLPAEKKLQQMVHDLLYAAQDKNPCILLGNMQIRRYRDDICCVPVLPAHDASKIYAWEGCTPFTVPGIGCIAPLFSVPQENLSVRFRQGGEIFWQPDKKMHQTLKHIFQAAGIPPWQRDRIPLVFRGERLETIMWLAGTP